MVKLGILGLLIVDCRLLIEGWQGRTTLTYTIINHQSSIINHFNSLFLVI